MLIVSSPDYLGDKLLSPQENLTKLKEGNAKLTESLKMHGQKELEAHERSAGPRMPYQEILRRLWSINSGIRVLDGAPGHVALYFLKNASEITDEKSPKGPFFDDHKYVGGIPKEDLPEYSHITVDEHGLPKREIRGWRSVLVTLIKAKAITYTQAVHAFGEALGPRSNRWHEQLRPYKT